MGSAHGYSTCQVGIGMMITVVHSYLNDTKITVDIFEHDTKNTMNEVLNVSKI